MAITASKPAINIREKLVELDQPQGLKGTEVLRADTADEARNAIGARGRRNLLFNGGFDVWQRGVSFTGSVYTADRWKISTVDSGLAVTKTANRDTYNTLKMTMAGVSVNIDQRVEAFGGIVYNKKVTVSFWVRGSGSFSNIKSRIRNHTTATNLEDASYNVTTSWTRITFTFSTNDTWAKDDVGRFYLMLGTNVLSSGDWVEFSNVQLELGDQATDFEHRSYGEELALCQRYYYRIDGSGYTWIAEVQRHNSTGFRSVISLPVAIRDTPTITYSNLAYWYNNGSLSAGTSSISTGYTSSSATDITQLNIEYVPTSMTLASNYNYSAMLSFTSAGGYLAFDAEL